MRPGRRLGAVYERKSLRRRGDFGPVLSIHPHVPRSFVVGHEAGAGQEAQEFEIVVPGQHVDGFEPHAIDRLNGARPDGRKRNGGAGNDDWIAPPCATPVGQDDARNGSLVIDPEQLVDRVRAPRRPPPPLQISRFPYPCLRILHANPPQELRR